MTETEQAPEQVETTHVDTPAPQTTEDSSSTAVEQQQEEQATPEAAETEATTEAAPQTWEGFSLTAPEGHDVDSVTAFADAAKEHGMAPDAAQKMLDKIVPVLQERQLAGINALHEEWIAQTKADPEIGGSKFEENMAIAKKAADQFGDEDLQTLLKPISEGGQGLGNNPVITRLLLRVGKAVSTDTKVVSGSAAVAEEDAAKSIYDKSDMN